MILKASQRGGGMQLAVHLLKPENEHVELHEISGFVADDLASAFKEVHAISKGTRCKQFLFSLSLNPPELENVPVAVFEDVIARIEAKIGLAGQPRAIVFHEKQGRRHAHCVWSRIDAAKMKAINLPHFKLKLTELSRQIYLEQGWDMPRGLEDFADRDPLNYSQAEAQQAKRVKRDARALKEMFQKCWAGSDSRAAFAHALKEQGFILARGSRRGFVAVDAAGEVYAIARWVGVKAKEVRARLGDLEGLPNVEKAIAILSRNFDAAAFETQQQVAAQDERRKELLEQKRLSLVGEQRDEREALRDTQLNRPLFAGGSKVSKDGTYGKK
ncbi:relaxase/mobilization nuclease domain-containing protein [Profundibacter sp.]